MCNIVFCYFFQLSRNKGRELSGSDKVMQTTKCEEAADFLSSMQSQQLIKTFSCSSSWTLSPCECWMCSFFLCRPLQSNLHSFPTIHSCVFSMRNKLSYKNIFQKVFVQHRVSCVCMCRGQKLQMMMMLAASKKRTSSRNGNDRQSADESDKIMAHKILIRPLGWLTEESIFL